MTITRWLPFPHLESMRQEMDPILRGILTRPGQLLSEAMLPPWTLPVDMYETPDTVVVRASMPGVSSPDSVDVHVTGELLTLKGSIPCALHGEGANKANWIHHELWCGEFTRTLTLPVPVQADKADARFEDGILSLTLPKAEEIKAKQIKVQSSKQTAAR